jgi:dTDP-4-dehydrorhamnose reductase
MLGQAVCSEVSSRGWRLTTAARSDADLSLDISDVVSLESALDQLQPDLLFNCAALTDVLKCEKEPGGAYCVNALPVAYMARWSQRTGKRLLHVSTDHYFTEGGSRPHGEMDQIQLVNHYARSKFAAEGFALTAPQALVYRTSIVGFRGRGAPTFAEWAIDAVLQNKPVGLFTDAYTSSIDVASFARAALDIGCGSSVGVLNLAAREVYSKARFVQEIALQLNRPIDNAFTASLQTQSPPRAGSLGLDVSSAQALLDFRLPDLRDVVKTLLDMHRKRSEG